MSNTTARWSTRLLTVAVIASTAFVARPTVAFADGDGGGEGACTAGKDSRGRFRCCTCNVSGEGREFVVSGCESSTANGYSQCQNGNDESTPRGTCGGSCEVGD